MADDIGSARSVPVGGGVDLRCLVCGGGSFWRRYPKTVHRIDHVLVLAEEVGRPGLRERAPSSWPGFAEVCAACGFVHWFSSEATEQRPEAG